MNNYFENAKECAIAALPNKGAILIIAPHQDDESLGCGGAIALAIKAGYNVHVIFVTDGSQSHPGSKKYPLDKLIALREKEAIAALSILGVKKSDIHFMRLPDGRLPCLSDSDFDHSACKMSNLLAKMKPAAVIVPWRRDPHKDHRATWEIVNSALRSTNINPVIFEYFIWLFERAAPDDIPQEQEGALFYIDISTTLKAKKMPYWLTGHKQLI